MGKIKLNWYHIVIPVVVILFCPITFLSIRPDISRDIIAVPANEPSMLSTLAPVFSRAPYFVIYDIKLNRERYLVNNFANKNYKVGLHVAHLLVDEKAGVVIGKNVGPEPYSQLTRRGVDIYEGMAINVQEAIYKLKNNMLRKINGPTGFSKIFPAG